MDENSKLSHVKVVVLGDIGRSPRMQYHALSLASHGFKVNIIGYSESTPMTEVLQNPNITINKLIPLTLKWGPNLLKYFLKAYWQSLSLLITLLMTGKCNYVLCQNPPAIPTLPVCQFYCLITRTKFIIDWHNYAFSIMAMASPNRILLKFAKYLEKYYGKASNYNFCVTQAMKEDLLKNWNIVAKVLYDRPPKIFHPITLEDKHQWFMKLSHVYPEFGHGRQQLNQPSGDEATGTTFTQLVNGTVEERPDRPGLLFSSTSWTEDEDFNILLQALQVYETYYNLIRTLPKLVCVITGKGPMKQSYLKQIASRKWQHIKVVTPWLEASDYPIMVASADLGVCLHTSSSGLDLPMKVVDMFGAGLPVLAYDYKCLNELVEDGVNGYIYKTNDELAKLIVKWFENFPNNESQNQIAQNMRKNLSKFRESTWEDNWNLRVKEFFN